MTAAATSETQKTKNSVSVIAVPLTTFEPITVKVTRQSIRINATNLLKPL